VRRKVREWQQLAGWINWVLNVYPLLWPSLNNIYAKLRGKSQESHVWVNTSMREDLEWAKLKLDNSDGVYLVKSLSWELYMCEAMCIIKTDTCMEGFAFWYPQLNKGFSTTTPMSTPPNQIIFYEVLAVLSALDDARNRYPSNSKIVVFTDNSVTISMFNTLRALPEYNCIIKAAVDILFDTQFQLRVLHVAGEHNSVADALSCSDEVRALKLSPGLTIRAFEPYHRVDRHQLPPILKPPRQLPTCGSGPLQCMAVTSLNLLSEYIYYTHIYTPTLL
jgi:hypothetical protein